MVAPFEALPRWRYGVLHAVAVVRECDFVCVGEDCRVTELRLLPPKPVHTQAAQLLVRMLLPVPHLELMGQRTELAVPIALDVVHTVASSVHAVAQQVTMRLQLCLAPLPVLAALAAAQFQHQLVEGCDAQRLNIWRLWWSCRRRRPRPSALSRRALL